MSEWNDCMDAQTQYAELYYLGKMQVLYYLGNYITVNENRSSGNIYYVDIFHNVKVIYK